MALANISLLLAQWGKKILIVDWDLEAPGLEHYFKDFIDPASVADRQGVLDLLHAASENDPRHDAETWQSHVMPIPLLNYEGKLDFIGSGRRGYDYFTRLLSLDVNSLYTEGGGGLMIEQIRSSWKEH